MQEISNNLRRSIWAMCPYADMVWVTSKADTSSLDQDGPLEVPLQVNK